MSALVHDRADRGRRPALTPVPSGPKVLGRTPFLLVLATVLVAGLVGVLLLNTTLQSRGFEVRRLQAKANELAYLRADLESKSRALATTTEIARRAQELGMVPNPYPVYVVVPSGEVRGVAKPVRGDELPLVGYKTPAEVAAARQAAVAPAAPPPAAEPAPQGDGVVTTTQGPT
jgi:hypothetical protein